MGIWWLWRNVNSRTECSPQVSMLNVRLFGTRARRCLIRIAQPAMATMLATAHPGCFVFFFKGATQSACAQTPAVVLLAVGTLIGTNYLMKIVNGSVCPFGP